MSEFGLLTHQQSISDSMSVVSGPSISATFALVEAPNGFGEEAWLPAVPESILTIRLRGATVEKASGESTGSRSNPFGNWALQPKGTCNAFRAAGSTTFGQVFLGDEFVDLVSDKLERPSISGRLRSDLVFSPDPAMEQMLARCIKRSFDAKFPPTAVEMEALALLVVDRLHTLHDGPCQPERRTTGLTPKRLRKVEEFFREHLDEDVRLVDLASYCGQSVKHFARAFRQSTGMPPHRYLVHLRIERAKELLARGRDPLCEISGACGFSDQSHFTATFRKIVGVPPGEYRSELQQW